MNDNIGELQFNVYAENVGAPIENAKVTITDRDSESIIEEFRTDSSGQTPFIELPAPPVEYSLNPESPKPYSEYNVFVESESFDKLFFEFRYFSKAIGNADMKLITGNNESTQKILIQEPVLWGAYPAKIPESEVKLYLIHPDLLSFPGSCNS